MSIDRTIQLLERWKKYTESGRGDDFSDFGTWLAHEETREEPSFFSVKIVNDMHTTFGFYLGSMVAFADAWEKLTFRDLPITGFMDFGILNHIQEEHNPTKKQIAARTVAEQSTVFESIKRLAKKGLLRDEVDQADKRVKRVYLTEEGAEVIAKVGKKAFHLARLLAGDLTDKELQEMIQLLHKLRTFHERLYHNRSKEEIIEGFGI